MVYVLAADGFEEIELIAPVDILRRCGVQVTVAGVSRKQITGSHGIVLTADAMIDDAETALASMIVLPGGSVGVKNLDASGKVHKLLREAVETGVQLAAICAAPSILQRQGLLDGLRFTCYPGCENPELGGQYTGAPVECDGRVITSRGAGTALLFGRALAAALCGEEKADKAYRALQPVL